MANNPKSGIVPVVHVSKPNAQGKGGGVEYVEVSGAEVTAAVWKTGLGPMLASLGMGHVQPRDVYLSGTGYGDERHICVRVKRDVAEGRQPTVAERAKVAEAKRPWTPGGGVPVKGAQEVSKGAAGPVKDLGAIVAEQVAAALAALREQAAAQEVQQAEVKVAGRRGRKAA